MDAPGFRADPILCLVFLIWLVPIAIAAAAIVAFVGGLRRHVGGLRRLLSVAAIIGVVVPAFFLALPAHRYDGKQTVGGEVECPLSGAAGSVMPGDHTSELYQFWKPCVTASRRNVGLSVGFYAIAAGAIGAAVLRAPQKRQAASRG